MFLVPDIVIVAFLSSLLVNLVVDDTFQFLTRLKTAENILFLLFSLLDKSFLK